MAARTGLLAGKSCNWCQAYPVAAVAILILVVPVSGQPFHLVSDLHGWQEFIAITKDRAQRTVATTYMGETHARLAERVQYELKEMKDPVNHLKGSQFGVAFSILIWNHEIPASHQEVVEDNPQNMRSKTNHHITLSGGMVPYESCADELVLWPSGTERGRFGWPCWSGGAVGFTVFETGRNCMVYFRPNDFPEDPQQTFKSTKLFMKALNFCMEPAQFPRFQEESAAKIGLTAFAQCTYKHFPSVKAKRPGGYRLKGVVVLPGVPVVASYQLYGLLSPVGHLIEELISVPRKSPSDDPSGTHELPDLNAEPYALFVIAALP